MKKRRKKVLGKCYACDAEATTYEHVPPRNLFPDFNDFNIDFRKNLIKVPSCKLHNTGKSKDDEYMIAALTMSVFNNEYGYFRTGTKIPRMLDHGGLRIEHIAKYAHEFSIKTEDREFPILQGALDETRIKEGVRSIALGIFRHHYGASFKGKMSIVIGVMNHTIAVNQALKLMFDSTQEIAPRMGANQKIFYYQIIKDPTKALYMLRLTFYEGTDIYVNMISETEQE